MPPHRIISADSHVIEPPELWKERLAQKYRDRAPHVEVRDGVEHLIIEGTYPRKVAGGRRPLDGDEIDRARAGGWDPQARIRDQERDGVAGEVVYPTAGLGVFMSPDPSFQMAMARAYNDWVHDVFERHRERFALAALVPTSDITMALSEVERAAAMGFRTLFLPVGVRGGRPYNDPVYDSLWAAVQGTGLPVTFHCGTGHEPRGERGLGGAVINYLLHAQGDGPYVVTYLCASGVLERFPNIHFITVETGAAWLAWVLQDMDLIYRDHHQWVSPKLGMLPSEYWKRQGHVGFQDDTVGVANRVFTGVDALLWGNDYPHREGTWPHSQEAIGRMFTGVPEDEVRRIVGGTAAAVYGFSSRPHRLEAQAGAMRKADV